MIFGGIRKVGFFVNILDYRQILGSTDATFAEKWVNLDVGALPVKSGVITYNLEISKIWEMLVVGIWMKWAVPLYFTVVFSCFVSQKDI